MSGGRRIVCALTGLLETAAGRGLGAEKDLEAPLLEPVLSRSVILPEGTDVPKALRQLKQLEEEDPLLHVVWNSRLEEIQMQLMGEVQTEVLKSMIAERYQMDVEFGAGRIMYKETIADTVTGVGHYEPLRHYAEVHLRMEPGERGSGLVFATDCSEDVLDGNWQRLILTHLREKEHLGVLAGMPITDMKITLTAGKSALKAYGRRRLPAGDLPGGAPGTDAGAVGTFGAVVCVSAGASGGAGGTGHGGYSENVRNI